MTDNQILAKKTYPKTVRKRWVDCPEMNKADHKKPKPFGPAQG
jgi:hypothetical protein